jgi:hypothetical protein
MTLQIHPESKNDIGKRLLRDGIIINIFIDYVTSKEDKK